MSTEPINNSTSVAAAFIYRSEIYSLNISNAMCKRQLERVMYVTRYNDRNMVDLLFRGFA